VGHREDKTPHVLLRVLKILWVYDDDDVYLHNSHVWTHKSSLIQTWL
jgi:hypothetical protein